MYESDPDHDAFGDALGSAVVHAIHDALTEHELDAVRHPDHHTDCDVDSVAYVIPTYPIRDPRADDDPTAVTDY